MRVSLRKFNRGLNFADPGEEIPKGALVRARGIDSKTPWQSRAGSTAVVAGDAHSIYYFNDYYFYATGTAFHASTRGVAIKTGLSGNRMNFARMAPRAGGEDALYACDGSNFFKVIYREIGLCSTDGWTWNVSGSGSDEYYITDTSGNESTFLVNPINMTEADTALTTGTLGSLSSGQWNFGDNDTLGFNTVYVRLADSTTPAPGNHADNYLRYISARAYNTGITGPTSSPDLETTGAGDLTGTYGYRCTFRNSFANIRSNPSPIPTSFTTPEPEVGPSTQYVFDYSFLCHFNGTENATTGTDVTARHAITFNGAAELDTTETVFGSAGLWIPGATGDYVSLKAHQDFVFDRDYTIDFRLKFSSLNASTAVEYGLMGQGDYAGRGGAYWRIQYNKGKQQLGWYNTNYYGGIYFNSRSIWTWNASSGTWYHIAFVRGWPGDHTGYLKMLVNGVALPQTYSTYDMNYFNAYTVTGGNADVRIGQAPQCAAFHGWMDEVRFYKGTAAWTANFTIPTAEYGASTGTAADGNTLKLTNIPTSNDSQVDTVEIWRTQANGTAFFKLAEIANGDTTFIDNIPDDQLGLEEVPLDNANPYQFFTDVIGPHNGAMFWITRSASGERGRLYYSAIGRAETMKGFIEVSSDDDPLQKLVYFQGMLGVFSESRFFQILGTDPYFVKEISGIPGTRRPHSAIMTPYGLAYEASDRSFRLLKGLNAERFDQPIARVLAGETVENLTPWGGGSSTTVATYARGEYLISDSSQTLAYNFDQQRWRDLGLTCLTMHYNPETDQLLATVGTNILEIEKTGEDDDNGTGIPYAVQTARVLLSDDKKGIIQHIHVDVDTNGETLEAELVYDDSSTKSLGNITGAARAVTTFPTNVATHTAGVRLTGTLSSGSVLLYGIDMDVYVPGEERQ